MNRQLFLSMAIGAVLIAVAYEGLEIIRGGDAFRLFMLTLGSVGLMILVASLYKSVEISCE